VATLGDVLNGTAEGRQSPADITLFDSTGLAIQDLAIALAAMERVGELDLPTIALWAHVDNRRPRSDHRRA